MKRSGFDRKAGAQLIDVVGAHPRPPKRQQGGQRSEASDAKLGRPSTAAAKTRPAFGAGHLDELSNPSQGRSALPDLVAPIAVSVGQGDLPRPRLRQQIVKRDLRLGGQATRIEPHKGRMMPQRHAGESELANRVHRGIVDRPFGRQAP